MLSEYFPSIPIMSALMGKTTEGSTVSATPGSAGFKGFALVRQCHAMQMALIKHMQPRVAAVAAFSAWSRALSHSHDAGPNLCL